MEPNIEEKEGMQPIEMLHLCWTEFKKHWKWFVFSVIACLIVGYVYIQRRPRVYQRQAVMLIEDADPSGGMGSSNKRRGNMSTLLELNGISVGDNLKNEIFILSSHRLMERVVDSLGLDVDYTMRESLHEIALYRRRPFELNFAEPCKGPCSFKVTRNGDKSFVLSEFRLKDGTSDSRIEVRPGQPVKTPVGTLTLRVTRHLATFPENGEVNVMRMPVPMAASRYLGEFSASEYDKESSLIVLGCSDINIARAEDVIREMYEAYKRDVVENKNRVANSTAAFIDERIRLIGEELGAVENRMAAFKRKNSLVDFDRNADIYLQESSESRRRTIELETQLAVANYLADFLKDRSNALQAIPALTISGADFGQQITEYNRLIIERGRMAGNSAESAPAVRELDRQLNTLRTAILGSVEGHTASVRLRLSKARATERSLSGVVDDAPDKEREGLDILRQQELKSALYTYLLNKREEVALQMAINEANVRLVEEPIGSMAPVSPRQNVILFVAFLLGVCIPVVFIFLRRYFDIRVRGRRDIEAVTTIPIVGDIPHLEENLHEKNIGDLPGDLPVVEAFRVLRYSLNFIRHSAKVFVVTSSTPGHGKTFISTNLSVVLGMSGKRVLLIDGDIRRRTLSKQLGMTPGLSAMLIDEEEQVSFGDVVKTEVLNSKVDFLPAGKLPPNPAELLMSDRFDRIIEQLRNDYDYIVIDTPPIVVADAGIIGRVADLTLFVIRVGVQERNFLPELEKTYKSKKFRNLCIAINDADLYGGRYGNGYRYGYSAEERSGGFFSRFRRK